VRLVRSKGVGVYFVTQNPLDIPDSVLAQLGNRVQHALRAFTPRDQKAVKATASTMRQKPGLDIETAITELAVGEALISFLDEKGRPGVTERVYVVPPGSQIGPITAAQRQALLQASLVAGVYEKAEDRESAYEILKQRTAQAAPAAAAKAPPAGQGTAAGPADTGMMGGLNELLFGSTGPRGGWCRPWPSPRYAPWAIRWAGKSCAACSAASWARRSDHPAHLACALNTHIACRQLTGLEPDPLAMMETTFICRTAPCFPPPPTFPATQTSRPPRGG